jgi:hypothetical protein
MLSDTLFDLLESEADDKYYLPNVEKEGWLEKPAFIICSGMYAKLGTSSWTVYMGRGLADWTFRTQKQARTKVIEVISKAKKPILKVKHTNFHERKEKILDVIQLISKEKVSET